MKIAVCIEKSGGMLFNDRRVSRDSMVQQKLLELVGEASICINEYSAKLFEDSSKLKISNDFLSVATDEDICFIENVDVPIDEASEVYLFQWNRDYPADVYFDYNLKECGFKKVSSEKFEGSSHKKITLEIYRRV
jgi:hypothetical protein